MDINVNLHLGRTPSETVDPELKKNALQRRMKKSKITKDFGPSEENEGHVNSYGGG